ncbi:MAG: hypothetical protein IPM96_14210 [Ignavibacteria bacterium]|nr:hypothetical protein [Ignavibacteria bacterium]
MNYLLNKFLSLSVISKFVWCLQNFLTMEFYRKICNNCYWSSVYSRKHNIFKQSLLLLVSIIPLFFSFFYSPADPANLNRSSFYTKLISLFTGLKISAKHLINIISNKIILLSDSLVNTERIKFKSPDIITLDSSYLI